jgi:hypothetical protein
MKDINTDLWLYVFAISVTFVLGFVAGGIATAPELSR